MSDRRVTTAAVGLFIVVAGGVWFLNRPSYLGNSDVVNTGSSETTVCTHPVFTEEYRLAKTIDGTSERTAYVAQAINYLLQKYCRTVTETLTAAAATSLGDNCTQYSGQFRGETVYWGKCAEGSTFFNVLK